MGLAATQVRLLQLTSRQHRVEYQAQRIQAQKLQLSNESDMVYNKYMTALDSKKIQYRYIDTDGSVLYYDATFENLFGLNDSTNKYAADQYLFEIVNGDHAGQFLIPSEITNKFNDIFEKNKDGWKRVDIDELNAKFNTDFNEDDLNNNCECIVLQKKYFAETEFLPKFTANTQAEKDYYINLFIALIDNDKKAYYDPKLDQKAKDYEWLTNMVENGELIIHKYNTEAGDDLKGAWTEVSLSTDIMLQEVADEKELKKAEATYEAETTKINRKDAQYDTLLSQTETERTAIKTEMEELKSVAKENIDKTFKLFS